MAVQINVAANQAALTASIAAGVQAYNQRFASQNQINLSINQRAFSQPLGRITGDVKDFNAAMAASNARVIAFGASTAVLGSAIAGFKSLASTTIEVEKNLTDINRILNLSTKQLQEYSSALFDISKNTATSFNDASKALLEFSRQGLGAEETLKRTNDALILTRLAGMGAEASVEALTSTVNGFIDSGITTTQVLNKLVAVEQSFAVSARDLSEGLSRSGQAAQEAGINIDQLNALITSAQQKTARGGAVIGNALKSIFTRLGRSETLDQLEQFNISVRDVQGNTLPAITILQNFAAAYNGLADAQRAQLSEQVAGVYQVNILKALISDLNSSQSVYNQAVSKGANASNEAAIANAKLNTTLSALLSQLTTNSQQAANNIGKITFEPLAKSAASAANSVLESFNELLTGEGIGSDFANGFLKGIRNLIAGPGAIAAFYTLFKLIQNSFSYLTTALPQIAGITTQTQNRKNIEQAILQIMQQQGPISQALAGQTGNQVAQTQLLLQLARQQTAEYQRQTALAQQLATSLSRQGVSVSGAAGLRVTRAGGFIPKQTIAAEKSGAYSGGYAPGQVVNSPVGGVMNTAEQVKYVPGFAQPFINPPSTSRAGKLHRTNAIKQTGIDPYMYGGFVPNFALSQINIGPKTAASVGKYAEAKADHNDTFKATIIPEYLDKTVAEYRRTAKSKLDKIYIKVANRKKGDPAFNAKALERFKTEYTGKANEDYLNRAITNITRVGSYGTMSSGYREALFQLQGMLGEVDARKKIGGKFLKGFQFFDLLDPQGGFVEVRTRKQVRANDIFTKSLKQHLLSHNYLNNNKIDNVDLGTSKVLLPKESPIFSKGFIPNFASVFGQPSNAKIASMISRGEISPEDARTRYGYAPSKEKIQQRAQQTAQKFGGYGFTTEGINGGANVIGGAFESIALNYVKSKYPNVIPAASYGGLSGGSTNTAIDALQVFPGNNGALFEFKGGDPTTYPDLQNKFTRAKQQIKNLVDNWKNIVIYNKDYGEMRGAKTASGGFIPNFNLNKNFDTSNLPQPTLRSKNEAATPFSSYKTIFDYAQAQSKNKLIQLSNKFEHEIGQHEFLFRGTRIGELLNLINNGKVSSTGSNDQTNSGATFLSSSFGKAASYGLRGVTGEKLLDGVVLVFKKQMLKNKKFDVSPFELEKLNSIRLFEDYSLSDLEGVVNLLTGNFTPIDKAVEKIKKFQQNKFNGFIPNFAYKQAVMGLEESMSGEKAIFSNSPFPHIRNASQPTFSSAIADHGGLSNALSDSMRGQKAAGLMNGGFVPNFARDKSKKDLERTLARIQERRGSSSVSEVSSFDPVAIEQQAEKLARAGLNKITNAFRYIGVFGASFLDQVKGVENATTKANRAKLAEAEKIEKNAEAQAQQRARKKIPPVIQAPPVIPQSNEEKIKAAKEAKAARNQKIANFGMSLAFLGPQIAGQLEQFAYGNKQRSDLTENQRMGKSFLSTGMTAISTGASMGSAFGPWGIAIGAAAGALVGLTSAFSAAKLTVEEMSEAMDQNNKKIIDASTNYQASFSKLQSAIESKDVSKQKEATQEMAKILAGLGDKNKDIQAKLGSAKSEKDIENIISEQRKSASARSALLGGIKSLSGEGEMSFFEKFQEKAGEAIINFSDSVVKLWKTVWDNLKIGFDSVVNYLMKGWEFVTKSASNFFSGLNDAFDGLTTYIGGALLGAVPSWLSGVDKEYTDEMKKEGKEKIISGGLKALKGASNLAASLLAIQNAPLALTLGAGYQAGKYLSEGITGDRKGLEVDNEFAKRQAQSLIAAGGGEGLPLLNKLFYGKNEKTNALLQSMLTDIAGTKSEDTRTTMIENFLNRAEVTGDDKMVLQKILEELSQSGNKVGQKTLANMQEVVKQAGIIVGDANITADNLAVAVKNFTRAKEEMTKNIADSIVQMNQNERNIEQQLKINALISKERGRVFESYGKPYAAASEEYSQTQKDIASKLQSDQRNVQKDVFKDFGDKLLPRLSGPGVTEFEKFYKEISDLPIEQQLQKLEEFQNKTANFLEPKDKEAADLRLKAYRESLKIAEETGANDLKYAEKVYQLKLKQMNEERSFSEQFKQGWSNLSNESDLMLAKLGKDIPRAFADGMTSALMEVAKGTKSIGDAFKDVAINFGQMLMETVMKAAMYKALGSIAPNLFGNQKGGIIQAQNGMYISGGRTGDRNLALLEDGEYVLNRNAVRAFGGKNALDAFNFKNAPRFGPKMATGGSFNQYAEKVFDPKTDAYDYSGNLISNGQNAGKINYSNYSAYAYEEDDYFKKVREKAIADEQERVRRSFERRSKNVQLISSIVGAAGSMFLSAGMSKMASPNGLKVKGLGGKMIDAGKIDKAFSRMNTTQYLSQKGGFIGYNSGGFVPHGSRLNDTIPALLTGGEYVMNNSAVKKYGLGTMHSMNAGAYASGGDVSNSSSTTNHTNNNATNISINVDRSGNAVYGSDSNSYSSNDVVLSKKMARQINSVVMSTITDQKRYGGKLHS